MVEGTNQKNLTIDLHIKSLSIKVTEHTPVCVIWSRGNKKAKTKSRLLNENVSQAVIDEKFQINTVMEVNEDGLPTKEKMSKLTVAGDKGKGVLGEADLNLSEYYEDEFKIFKIPLRKCFDPDAYIEVGLRATAKDKSQTPKNSKGEKGGSDSAVHQLLDDLEKAKKDQRKQKDDYEVKIKGLNEKINSLQTNLENTKTDLAFLHKVKKGLTNDKEVMEKEIETLKRKLVQREDSIEDEKKHMNELKEQLKQKDLEISQVQSQIDSQKGEKDKELKEVSTKLDQMAFDMKKFYDFERFDINYLADAVLFTKADTRDNNLSQVVISQPGSRQRQ